MRLNDLSPAKGAKKTPKRLGRGIGSGLGKTSGKGHKGQKARSGGYHKVGFEGGQMPLQRRLPKRGFNSRCNVAQVRTSELERANFNGDIDLEALKKLGIIAKNSLSAKIFLSGEVTKAIVVKGVAVSKGARAAIEAVGGSIAI